MTCSTINFVKVYVLACPNLAKIIGVSYSSAYGFISDIEVM